MTTDPPNTGHLRRFFIAPEVVSGEQAEISGSDAGHICRVLRLGVGDVVELFDGHGQGYRARIESAAPKRIALAIEARYDLPEESPVRITMAQAMLKDRKMDDLVRPLTELGMHRWLPFSAARSVSKPDQKRTARRRERWEKIALEAVKQCRRSRIPRIEAPVDFDGLLHESENYDRRIICWEETPKPFDGPDFKLDRPGNVLLVIGPEGGFTADEIEKARDHGFFTAGLGPRILRAQTAALAAFTLVQYCLGDMGREVGRLKVEG